MKATSRSTSSGRKKESITARWLEARIAAPSTGMFSSPRIHGW